MTVRVKQRRSKESTNKQQSEVLRIVEKSDNNEIQNPQQENQEAAPQEEESQKDDVPFVKADNFTGRGGALPDMIVLHHTGLDYKASVGWWSKGSPRSSTHFVVGRSGAVTQLVELDDYSRHTNDDNINRISVGIHLEALTVGQGLTKEQNDSLADLIRMLQEEIPSIRYLFRNTDLFPTQSQSGIFAFKYRQDLERFIISNGIRIKYPIQRGV